MVFWKKKKPEPAVPTASPSKPDFSGVSSRTQSTAPPASPAPSAPADFSGVTARVDTTADKVGEQSYTVQSGDTLSHIAQRFYGKASAWNAIYQANRDQIDNPDLIRPGQVLRIPDAGSR